MGKELEKEMVHLKTELRRLGIDVEEDCAWDKLAEMLELIRLWGDRCGLTAITDPREGIWLHVFDSLSCVPLLRSIGAGRIADIGSGAGLPGIPVKIVLPFMEVVLVERTRKKVAFLERVCLELGLKGVKVVWGRAEDVGRAKEYSGRFDAVTARAFGGLRSVCAAGGLFVREGGRIIAFKGPSVDEELDSVGDWPGSEGVVLEAVCEFALPRGYGLRRLVVMKKETRAFK